MLCICNSTEEPRIIGTESLSITDILAANFRSTFGRSDGWGWHITQPGLNLAESMFASINSTVSPAKAMSSNWRSFSLLVLVVVDEGDAKE